MRIHHSLALSKRILTSTQFAHGSNRLFTQSIQLFHLEIVLFSSLFYVHFILFFVSILPLHYEHRIIQLNWSICSLKGIHWLTSGCLPLSQRRGSVHFRSKVITIKKSYFVFHSHLQGTTSNYLRLYRPDRVRSQSA